MPLYFDAHFQHDATSVEVYGPTHFCGSDESLFDDNVPAPIPPKPSIHPAEGCRGRFKTWARRFFVAYLLLFQSSCRVSLTKHSSFCLNDLPLFVSVVFPGVSLLVSSPGVVELVS